MWVRSTASRRVKSSPAETNADGDPRPQSTTNTRPSTTTADEIPPRPATGIGAPAVPSRTSSVATPPPEQRKPSALQPEPVERHRHDAVRQLPGPSAARPVPLH